LSGRAVLVTGGADGIGRAVAEAFLAQGSRVAVLDIAGEKLTALQRLHPALISRTVDLCDIAATENAIKELCLQTGPITVLVNNAAHDDRHPFETLTPDAWDENMAVNLRHIPFVTQAVLPGMREVGRGSIVTLGSTSWMKGAAGLIAYATAKSAITGFTRSLARELGTLGIRVNAVAPGWVLTERQLSVWSTPEKRQANLQQQALKHEISSSDIADAVLFLASDSSRSITGQQLVVDGGTVYG
jgi:NAD(P)-dependent dehydrogenase (short-subunit alcohol dehydrogenase family)